MRLTQALFINGQSLCIMAMNGLVRVFAAVFSPFLPSSTGSSRLAGRADARNAHAQGQDVFTWKLILLSSSSFRMLFCDKPVSALSQHAQGAMFFFSSPRYRVLCAVRRVSFGMMPEDAAVPCLAGSRLTATCLTAIGPIAHPLSRVHHDNKNADRRRAPGRNTGRGSAWQPG